MAMTFYDLLGIPKCATPDEVRLGFKKKALTTHPDKLGPDATLWDRKAAETKFRNLHEAFETLSDPAKRRAYDMRLEAAARFLRTGREREFDTTYAEHIKKSAEQLNVTLQEISQTQQKLNGMVDDLLKGLREANPEWEARKLEALRQREAHSTRAS
ncbi:DnaJ-domain-containing protein [Neolentinus lepideus HHB14362 ss-1]|uniref:DnaJ-domain-containing protein n=1 Tax=Neolentinus lepideus HHB14362 ss-1 TaxID=1314782 RepID=A0A165U9A2_9AGAM|nr:DnaJ-domain-containing protein [Neolentinus lepideus HHB14362 ss-1]